MNVLGSIGQDIFTVLVVGAFFYIIWSKVTGKDYREFIGKGV